jgi:hypothetical protein
LVETRKRILSKAKLALRPMTILASLTRRQGSSINVPLRGTPLTPLRLAELEVCIEPHKKTLDNADDVIRGLKAKLTESPQKKSHPGPPEVTGIAMPRPKSGHIQRSRFGAIVQLMPYFHELNGPPFLATILPFDGRHVQHFAMHG